MTQNINLTIPVIEKISSGSWSWGWATPGGDTDPMQSWISYVIATQPGNKKSIFVNNKDGSYNLNNIPSDSGTTVTLQNWRSAGIGNKTNTTETYLYELTRWDYYTIFEKDLWIQKLNSQTNTKIYMWFKASDYETLTAWAYLQDWTATTLPENIPTENDLVYYEQNWEKYFFTLQSVTWIYNKWWDFDIGVYKINWTTSEFVKTISWHRSSSPRTWEGTIHICSVSNYIDIWCCTKPWYYWENRHYIVKIDVANWTVEEIDCSESHGDQYNWSTTCTYAVNEWKYYICKWAWSWSSAQYRTYIFDIENDTCDISEWQHLVYNDWAVKMQTSVWEVWLYHDYYKAIFDSQGNVEYIILPNDSSIATPTDKIVDIDIDWVVKTFYTSDLQSKEFNNYALLYYWLASNIRNSFISVTQANGLINTYDTQNDSLSIRVKTYVDKIHINAWSVVQLFIY